MRLTLAAVALALAGCATGPMTPQQHQILMQSLQNQQRSSYQVIQPQPLAAPQPTRLHPITCTTYRGLGGTIQTDCQ